MVLAVCTMSHSPLMGSTEPPPEVAAGVDDAFARAREFIADFDPDLTVIFAPDHYNGVLYDLMPPFCIGAAAESVGDYGTQARSLTVDEGAATTIAGKVMSSEVDVALSYRLHVDHGFAQPLQILFGDVDATPVVPIFINCVATPLGPVRRARLLGEAVGRAVSTLDRRVLVLGSGGLSHDPPMPTIEGADPAIFERLVNGHLQSPEQRQVREQRTIRAAQQFAQGESGMQALNPDWDNTFLDTLAAGDLSRIDSWSNDDFVKEAGSSAHEVRTWIAAYSALASQGDYTITDRFYHPIPEWIAGFAVTTAVSSH